MKTVTPLMLALAIVVAGCGSSGGSAKITEMIPGMSPEMDKLECWLTLVFKNMPEEDASDVEVCFTSIALEEGTECFDWEYIAKKDIVSKGFMKGFAPNDASQPDDLPPIGIPIKIKFPLVAKKRIKLEPSEIISLNAELYWGGEKMAAENRTIEHVYKRE